MKFKVLLRPALTIVFGFVGTWVAQSGIAPVFLATSTYFIIVAFLAFGVLGFILPDIIERAGQAGIKVLARQLAGMILMAPNAARKSFKSRKKHRKYINPMIVDTSALIDGRLVDVARSGFMYGSFIIIPSVVHELQRLADSGDEEKRIRGRRGLDNLAEIQKIRNIKVEIMTSEPSDKEVDSKLLSEAKRLKGKVITVDFNLNKVAMIKKIKVLNVNELAGAIKTVVSPNEKMEIKISALGREKGQGVGYLEDGTMIVVENGAKLKGKTIIVQVSRVFQTAAGKMVFAKTI